MAHQSATSTVLRGRNDAVSGAASDTGVYMVGALLALGVAAVHVADQGGVTAFTSPDWIGWSYRRG